MHGANIEAWREELRDAPMVRPVTPDRVAHTPRRTEPLVRPVPLGSAATAATTTTPVVEVAVAALAALVLRYTGQTDLLVGLLDDELVVPRLRVSGGLTASQVRAKASAAIARAAELGPIAEDDLLAIAPHKLSSAACHAIVALRRGGNANRDELRCADLVLVLQPVRDRVRAALAANAARYKPATVERLAMHLGRIIDALTGPDAGHTLATLPLLGAPERNRIIVGWNDTAEPVPGAHLPDLVAALARNHPDTPAVVHGSARWAYGRLDSDANRLANHLAGLGVRDGEVVAVLMPRCPEHLVAQLAAWRIGATVLLLDPDHPDHRLAYLLADSPAAAVLTLRGSVHRLAGTGGPRMVVLDIAGAAWRAADPGNPGRRPRDADISHIAYTAGSTGPPKAVLLHHGSLRNTVHVLRAECAITPGSRGTWLSAPGLGLIQADVFPVLAAGATVHIPDDKAAGSVGALQKWFLHTGITHTLVGVGRAQALWELDWPQDCALRSMRVVGQQVPTWPPPDLPFSVLNVYGSAEANAVATCDLTTTAAALTADERVLRRPPIGRPVANSRAYVLGEDREPVPPGVLGELHVSGAGLARGYMARPEATNARFAVNPFPEDPNPVLYRTGDLARYWPNGVIELVGRLDDDPGVQANQLRLGELNRMLAGSRSPGDAVAEADAAAGAEVTRRIAALFGAVLGREVTGTDDFFASGGDEAAAHRLLQAVHADLGVALTIADLRRAASADGVAHLVVRAWLGGAPPTIVPDVAGRNLPFPLTQAQRQLWHASGGRAGPMDLYEWHEDELDAGQLRERWLSVTTRHDALHTIVRDDGQQVALDQPPPVRFVDLTGEPPHRVAARIEAARHELIELDGPPVLRISALPGDTAIVQLAVSPLLVDHESMHRLVLPELAAVRVGRSLPPPPAITFRDYAGNSLTRWSQPDLDPVAPSDWPLRGALHPLRRELSATLTAGLRQRCAAAATEPADAIVAALHDVVAGADLTWLSASTRLLVQRTTHRVLADPVVEQLAGCFTVWRRVELDTDNPTFADRARALAACPAGPAPIRCAVQVAVAVDEPGPGLPWPLPASAILARGPLADSEVRVVLDGDVLRMHWTVPAAADTAQAAALADRFADRLACYAEDAPWWDGVDRFNKSHGQSG